MQYEPLIDVKNLCSRKLWEILKVQDPSEISMIEQLRIQQELISRQHYVQELSTLPQRSHSH